MGENGVASKHLTLRTKVAPGIEKRTLVLSGMLTVSQPSKFNTKIQAEVLPLTS